MRVKKKVKKKVIKYHNGKVETPEGRFDSQREYMRWCVLKRLQEDGVITDLERQKKFTLIPAQREPDTRGKRGGLKKGKVIERECSYIADFAYYDKKADKYVVEDAKGIRTKDYIIKRKLMLWVHNVRICET